ncbi:MAG TPA: hypothetical protein VMD99_18165 [Terriglobales bacterium]|nr:hypothetical protein [Terriglobales bacterium]
MELLLNLVWLLLALPAYWLWRDSSRGERKFSSLQCLLALGCVLVVLFPVISATDDLRAMRAEMEESPASKRNIRQATAEKASSAITRLQTPPALLGAVIAFSLEAGFHQLSPRSFVFDTTALVLPTGRAPPLARLA